MTTTSNLEIRLARPDEQDAVTSCVLDAYSKWVPILSRKPTPMLADYGELIARGVVYVVPSENGLRGLVIIWPEDGAMLIENLCVCPNHQRQGLGHILLNFAEDQARAAGLDKMRLYTNALMDVNIALYLSVGYHEIRRETKNTTEPNFTVVYMEKPL